MTFFGYVDAHPVLTFIWFVLAVGASYAVPVAIFCTCVNIIRTPRSPAVVTPARLRGF